MRLRYALGPLAALTLISQISAADVVTDWNSTAVDVVRRLNLGSNRGTRALAIAHIAAYDAVVSVSHTHEPYLAYLPVTAGADAVSLEAAVASAAHDALLSLYPADAGYLDEKLTASLADIPDGPAKDAGIDLGHRSAVNIVFARVNDGAAVVQTYAPPFEISQWIPTPPGNAPALNPEWRSVKPFAILSPEQFRAPEPPAIAMQEYAEAFNAIKAIGSKTSTTRTEEQTEIANFWAQQTQVPFNAIARTVSADKALTLEENARLFALLNIALADSRIAAWDSKYHYGTWRPVTAIRFPFHDAETDNDTEDDGNPDTTPDESWEPLLETPAHPDYVSGHSATGAAGAALLAAVFGDETSFELGSDSLVNTERSFTSFTAAAEENAASREYAGLHFNFANQQGLELGTKVGNYVGESLLAKVEGAGGGAGGGGNAEGGASGEEGGAGGAPSKPLGKSGYDKALIDRYSDDHGCSCATVGGGSESSALGWLSGVALAALAFSRARRRQR